MYKILFVSGSLAQNGTEMFMMNVLRNIDKDHFHIDFCIFSDEMTPNRIEAESLGCKVFVLPSRHQGLIKSVVASWNFLKVHAHDYNAVHWNGGNLSSFIRFAMYKYFRIPIRIVHAHSSSAVGFHNKVLHRIHKKFIGFVCTHFFACSSEAAKFFYNARPSIIINNGIDIEKFNYNSQIRDEVRREFNIPLNSSVLGHVGRFDNNKNHSFLLDVFAEYCKIHNHAYLILVGQGYTFDAIKKKSIDMGLADRVIFTGVRYDVNRLLQAFDCFVMPSKFEGFPFALVEAQCSGLLCVISNTVNRDVNLTGNVIFLSLNEGAQKWSNTINYNLSTYQRSPQGKVIADKGFSIKKTVKYLEKVYSNS